MSNEVEQLAQFTVGLFVASLLPEKTVYVHGGLAMAGQPATAVVTSHGAVLLCRLCREKIKGRKAQTRREKKIHTAQNILEKKRKKVRQERCSEETRYKKIAREYTGI